MGQGQLVEIYILLLALTPVDSRRFGAISWAFPRQETGLLIVRKRQPGLLPIGLSGGLERYWRGMQPFVFRNFFLMLKSEAYVIETMQ